MTTDRTDDLLKRLKTIGKREASIAAVLLGFGFLILPACVYFVGDITLGPYGAEGGIKGFYVNLFRALSAGNAAGWILITGPYALIQFARLLWLPLSRKPVNKSP